MNIRTDHKVVILGAGVAGLSALCRLQELGIDCVLLEAQPQVGGHAKSSLFKGFRFDEGPHVLFSADREMLEWLGSPTPEKFDASPKIANLWNKLTLGHPAQLDFASMPLNLAEKIASEILAESADTSEAVSNYAMWLESSYGKFVTDSFHRIYTRKYWCCEVEELGTDWAGKRVHKVSREQKRDIAEMLKSRDFKSSKLVIDSHYLKNFIYDTNDGFLALFPRLLGLANVKLQSNVASIDMENKIVSLSNGKELTYDFLISSIPLPELIRISKPSNFGGTQSTLNWTSLTCHNFLVNLNSSEFDGFTWIYNYDESSPVARISFPQYFSSKKTFSVSNVLQVQAEEYCWNGDSVSEKTNARDILQLLQAYSILDHGATVLDCETKFFKYANIVPDLNQIKNSQSYAQQFSAYDIHLVGRYGQWQYLWTVESARSGRDKADQISALIHS